MTELKKKTKKLNRELQHHGWSSRKKNQWTWNQIIWSYLVRGTKRKSNEGEWRKPPGLTGTTKESLKNVGVQKLQRRRKSWRSYSKKQWESFPNRGQKTNNRIHEAQITPARLNMERSLARYILFMLPKVSNRDNFESMKRRRVCHIHKTISVFLRSLVGPERVRWCAPSTKATTAAKWTNNTK